MSAIPGPRCFEGESQDCRGGRAIRVVVPEDSDPFSIAHAGGNALDGAIEIRQPARIEFVPCDPLRGNWSRRHGHAARADKATRAAIYGRAAGRSPMALELDRATAWGEFENRAGPNGSMAFQ